MSKRNFDGSLSFVLLLLLRQIEKNILSMHLVRLRILLSDLLFAGKRADGT